MLGGPWRANLSECAAYCLFFLSPEKNGCQKQLNWGTGTDFSQWFEEKNVARRQSGHIDSCVCKACPHVWGLESRKLAGNRTKEGLGYLFKACSSVTHFLRWNPIPKGWTNLQNIWTSWIPNVQAHSPAGTFKPSVTLEERPQRTKGEGTVYKPGNNTLPDTKLASSWWCSFHTLEQWDSEKSAFIICQVLRYFLTTSQASNYNNSCFYDMLLHAKERHSRQPFLWVWMKYFFLFQNLKYGHLCHVKLSKEENVSHTLAKMSN